MTKRPDTTPLPTDLEAFSSAVVDRVTASGNSWKLPGGEILLPGVFGFCRGVKRALAMLDAVVSSPGRSKRLFLLGEIIHNPWVNRYFEDRGVSILSASQLRDVQQYVRAEDCAIIPAFGVPLAIEKMLTTIGCQIVDTSCGDVRRLWVWAQRESKGGFGIIIFGRADHDETVVTKSRLDAAGGKYLVLGSLDKVQRFCELIRTANDAADPGEAFGPASTNASTLEPFLQLAQVSQTTMLYDDTMEVRRLIEDAFEHRFGSGAAQRLMFQPTVCRATQDRQAAAVELCRQKLDLAVVVGGFGSSNTRHLYELARGYSPAVFIEDAAAIVSDTTLNTMDLARQTEVTLHDWLPSRRPLRVGVLAGASSPEIVIGQVLEKLALFLSKGTAR